jgi:uncharacterized protein DUF2877
MRTLQGRVVSVHRAAVYVALEPRRDLLVIAIDDVGGVPGGLLVDGVTDLRTTRIAPGMAITRSGAALAVPDAGLTIALAGARVWSPLLPPAARLTGNPRSVAGGLAATVVTARALAGEHASAGGLGPILRGDARPGDPWLRTARERIDRQRWAFAAGDLASILGEAVELIGLGPGLTPSGDDYLVGLLAGLDAAGHRSRPALATAIVHAAPSLTTWIGAASLAHAARGGYTERLHDVLVAITAGGDDERLATAIERAMGYGATSGADTLVGLFAALDIAVAERHGRGSEAA